MFWGFLFVVCSFIPGFLLGFVAVKELKKPFGKRRGAFLLVLCFLIEKAILGGGGSPL